MSKKIELKPVKIREATSVEKENFLKDCKKLLDNVNVNRILIEIKLPTKPLEVYPEEGMTEDDFKGKKKQKELEDFRKAFLVSIKDSTKKILESYMDDFEDYFLDNADDISIEGFESLKDYGIEIKII